MEKENNMLNGCNHWFIALWLTLVFTINIFSLAIAQQQNLINSNGAVKNTPCSCIVFSNRAYNSIIVETQRKNPLETGGILLGHILDNGFWIVMEVLPPGSNSIFEVAYFEYDDAFVNYLAQSVANQYKVPLELVGLWHRHPGSFDSFSSTDDQTNMTFASLNANGAISGLVNIDPSFRLTMYHVANSRTGNSRRPNYCKVDIEVGDDIIPDEYFKLKYPSIETLHPIL